jgi:hypothetical protein
MYFRPVADEETGRFVWSDLGNWYMDSAMAVAATSLPGSLDDCYAEHNDYQGNVEMPATVTIKSLTATILDATIYHGPDPAEYSGSPFVLNADSVSFIGPSEGSPEMAFNAGSEGTIEFNSPVVQFNNVSPQVYEGSLEVDGNVSILGSINFMSFPVSTSGDLSVSPSSFFLQDGYSSTSGFGTILGNLSAENYGLYDAPFASFVGGSIELLEGFFGMFCPFPDCEEIHFRDDAKITGPCFFGPIQSGVLQFHDESVVGGTDLGGTYRPPLQLNFNDSTVHVVFRDNSKIAQSALEYQEFDAYDGFYNPPEGSTIRFRDNARNELGVKTYEVKERGVNGSSILGVV